MGETRGLWKPSDKPLGKYERHQWNTRYRNVPKPSARKADENTKIAEREALEWPVKEAYEGVLDHRGYVTPVEDTPALFFMCKKDGTRIIRVGVRLKLAWDDPKLLEHLRAEEDVKIVTCPGQECGEPLPVIMKLEISTSTGKQYASVGTYCPKCLTVKILQRGAFKIGKIRKGKLR